MPTALKVEQLAKSFTGVRALDGVDVEVDEGEILGLVGPNGSGKTTVFNCVTGFVRPTGGRIIWHDQDITQLAPDQIARLGVIRTFQQKMVFPRASVAENLSMGWRERGGDKSGRAFHGWDEILQFLGLDAIRDQAAVDIPFGSARTLGVGLALAADPQLLMLDEPAAGLNPDERDDLATLISKVTDLGITVWVIEHDMNFLMSIATRIVVLHAGRKIAEGKPAEIANDPNVISVYLGDKFAKDRGA